MDSFLGKSEPSHKLRFHLACREISPDCIVRQHSGNHEGTLNTVFTNGLSLTFLFAKMCIRKAPMKVEYRRSDTGIKREAYKRNALITPVKETIFYPSPSPIRTLVKPFIFSVGAVHLGQLLFGNMNHWNPGARVILMI